MHKRLPPGYTRAKTEDLKKIHFAFAVKNGDYTRGGGVDIGGYTPGITVADENSAFPTGFITTAGVNVQLFF